MSIVACRVRDSRARELFGGRTRTKTSLDGNPGPRRPTMR